MARTIIIRIGSNPRKINPLWNWVLLVFALGLFVWNLAMLITQAPNGVNNNPANAAIGAALLTGTVGNFIEQRRWKKVQLAVSCALLALSFWLMYR